MGECGCSEIGNITNIVKIGEFIMVIEIYPGCPYCKTGIAVNIHLFTAAAAKDHGFDCPSPELELGEYGYTDLFVPIIEACDLIESLGEVADSKQYDNVKSWLEDSGRELLTAAVFSNVKRRENTPCRK